MSEKRTGFAGRCFRGIMSEKLTHGASMGLSASSAMVMHKLADPRMVSHRSRVRRDIGVASAPSCDGLEEVGAVHRRQHGTSRRLLQSIV